MPRRSTPTARSTPRTSGLPGQRTVVVEEGAEDIYQPRFTFHGFRYVEVTGYPGEPSLDAITGRVAHSAAPTTGNFECSNPMVNQLQSNIVWGQRKLPEHPYRLSAA